MYTKRARTQRFYNCDLTRGAKPVHHNEYVSGQQTWLNIETEFLSGYLTWLFQKKSQICPDLLPAVFNFFGKSVRICQGGTNIQRTWGTEPTNLRNQAHAQIW